MTLDLEALRRIADDVDVSVARMLAHDAFDPLWKNGEMTRTQAYRWLADAMGLPPSAAHMEQFTAEQCREVVRLVAARKAR